MTRRILAALTALVAVAAAVLLAGPALAGTRVTAAPAQTVDANARVCAALTVDGVALLQDQPSLVGLLGALPVTSTQVTPAQIADARNKLGCGPAPQGRGDATLAADVCAALRIGDVDQILGKLELTAQAQAVVNAARPAAPALVENLRRDLQCGPDTLPGTTAPAPSGSAPSTGSPGIDGVTGGPTTTNSSGITSPAPIGAPETGA